MLESNWSVFVDHFEGSWMFCIDLTKNMFEILERNFESIKKSKNHSCQKKYWSCAEAVNEERKRENMLWYLW